MKITGIDLSLTATGVATITHPGRWHITLDTITSAGRKTASLADRERRLRAIRNTVIDVCRGSDLVVIEGPAFGAHLSGTHDRAGLWWAIIMTLAHLNIPVIEVPPATLKKFAADKGNADKTAVAAGLTRLWARQPSIQPAGDDQFDALGLASIGLVRTAKHANLEPPFPVLERHHQALAKIDWSPIE